MNGIEKSQSQSQSQGCNVVIKNLHLKFLFFQKILKIELNKGLQSLF